MSYTPIILIKRKHLLAKSDEINENARYFVEGIKPTEGYGDSIPYLALYRALEDDPIDLWGKEVIVLKYEDTSSGNESIRDYLVDLGIKFKLIP